MAETHNSKIGLIIVGICCLWFVSLLIGRPDQPIIVPDSQSYINFFSFRSAGYPIFLMIVDVSMITWVQPMIAAASLGFLIFHFHRMTQSMLWTILSILFIVANYRFNVYHYSVFTESIYMSILMLIVGNWIRYSYQQSLSSLVWVSILIGMAIALRPAAAFLVPLIIIAISLELPRKNSAKEKKPNSRGSRVLIATLVPMLLIIAAEKTFTYYSHEGNTSSLLGRHLFAKAALIGEYENDALNPYEAALNQHFEQIRAFIRAAPNFAVKNHFVAEYEQCAQYGCSDMLGLEPGSEEAKAAAIKRIKRYPFEYLQLALFNYRSLWTIYSSESHQAAMDINRYIQKAEQIPFPEKRYWLYEPARPGGLVKSGLRIFLLVVAILSFLTILQTLYLRLRGHCFSPAESTRAFCAFALHGSLFTIALIGPSVTRYLIVLWPLIILYTILLVEALTRRANMAHLVKIRIPGTNRNQSL